jgi:CBS domain-containing protein
MLVRDVMTIGVRMVRPEASIFQIAKMMRDEDIGAVPVVENDKLVGMITDRDVVVRGLAAYPELKNTTAKSVMSTRVLYCFEDQSVEEVLDNMGDLRVRRMPVVDRDKRLVGMVSLGDLSTISEPDRSGYSLSLISQHTH